MTQFLFCLAILMVLQPSQKTDTHTASQRTPESKPAASTVSTPSRMGVAAGNQLARQNGKEDGTRESASYVKRLFAPENLPNIVLCVVGIAGVIVAIRTLAFINRQAKEMRRQRILMRGQLSTMRRQLNEMQCAGTQTDKLISQAEVSANAAKNSAEAAQRNIELFISKERARLRIAVSPLVFPATPTELFRVDYEIVHFGQTDAIITSSATYAVVNDSENDAEFDPDLIATGPIPQVIRPSQQRTRQFQAIWRQNDYLDPTTEDIEAVRQGNKYLHFWGFWNYHDAFGNPRTTKFRFLWRRNPFQFGQKDHTVGYWQLRGDQDDNVET